MTPLQLLPPDTRPSAPPRQRHWFGDLLLKWAARFTSGSIDQWERRTEATEARLALAERRLAGIFAGSADALLLCNHEGQVIAANPAAAALTQRSVEALLGTACRSLIDQAPAFDGSTALRNGDAMVHREGGNVPVELHFEPLANLHRGASADWLVRMRDMTDRRETQDRLVQLANFDSLTGLPNRVLFRARLDRAMQSARHTGRPLALMFLDLDRFKVVNDSLGHEAGDRLLLHVAKALGGCLRRADSLARPGDDESITLSRLGGDEFTVIAENLGGPDDAALIAQRMLDAMAVPYLDGVEEIVVSASIGITMYPGRGEDDADRLLRHTDMAMYRAKSLGRGTFCFFSEDLHAAMAARLSLENALRRAVEREEFRLCYQPKARLSDGTITGVEALLRWHAPGRGMVPPDRFIGTLEETGLILPVGAWVVRTACAQLAAWDAEGLPELRMAVNLSARQVRHAHLARHVEDTLLEYGVEPARLEIELTESMLMEDSEATRSLLADFARLGVRIALDDFGTGHSSLSYLKRFNVHTLKVDKSFVAALPESGEDKAIAQAVVVMAKSLGMRTVAEGVETAAQLDILREMGCDEVQGYLIGRPLPAEELGAWLVQLRQRERSRQSANVRREAQLTRLDIELDGDELESPAERSITLWAMGSASLESASSTALADVPIGRLASDYAHESAAPRTPRAADRSQQRATGDHGAAQPVVARAEP